MSVRLKFVKENEVEKVVKTVYALNFTNICLHIKAFIGRKKAQGWKLKDVEHVWED